MDSRRIWILTRESTCLYILYSFKFAYSFFSSISCSWVPVSATIPSFMHLETRKKRRFQQVKKEEKKKEGTHIIWSACLVRCPNRWVTKIIIDCPSLTAITWSRSNNINSLFRVMCRAWLVNSHELNFTRLETHEWTCTTFPIQPI